MDQHIWTKKCCFKVHWNLFSCQRSRFPVVLIQLNSTHIDCDDSDDDDSDDDDSDDDDSDDDND